MELKKLKKIMKIKKTKKLMTIKNLRKIIKIYNLGKNKNCTLIPEFIVIYSISFF